MTGIEIKKEELKLDEIKDISKIFYQSGLFQDVRSEAQAVVKILAGRELGLPPLLSMTKISIVKGKIVISAEIMANLIKRSGEYDYRVEKLNNEECEIKFLKIKNGQEVEIGKSIFTIEDAKRAGLTEKMEKEYNLWEKYPRNLLFARALSNGARWFCPHLIGEAYTPEELGQEIVEAEIVKTEEKTEEVWNKKWSKEIDELFNQLEYGEEEKKEYFEAYKKAYGDKVEEKLIEVLKNKINTEEKKVLVEEKKTEEKKEIKKDKKIIKIHKLAKELGWSEEDYRFKLKTIYGVNSSKELSEEEKDNFISILADLLNKKIKEKKKEEENV